MSHFTDFTGYVLFIITSFLANVESADQCLLNSKVLTCFSGVIMSIRSFFLLTYPLSVLYPETSTGINVIQTGSHLLIKSAGQIFILIVNSGDICSSSDMLDDNLGPFKVKSGACAPVSEDIALETFLATIEHKLFDVHRACHHPVSNLSKSEHKTLHRLHTSKGIVVRLQDKGSRFVILDRTHYIHKVESNVNDGSFDLLPADPSSSYYQRVRDWGVIWVNKGKISQPLLFYMINPEAKPGKNYSLIKTHKPNNPI